jgi:hypothetical protein
MMTEEEGDILSTIKQTHTQEQEWNELVKGDEVVDNETETIFYEGSAQMRRPRRTS